MAKDVAPREDAVELGQSGTPADTVQAAVRWPPGEPWAIDGDRPGAQAVRDHLRNAILRGELPPDVTVSQVQLARQLGISRTPLREALRMLEAEGLVYAQANRMVRITATSLSDLEEIYAARIVLEAAGVSLTVPKLTAPDLEELARSLASLDVASSARDLESWEASHRLFHHLMRQYAGRRMDAIAQGLSDECGRYRRLYLSDDGARIAGASREHHEILDAAVQRNASLASRLIARHLGRTALTDAASLAPERDPALVREALRFALGTVPSADARSDG